MVEVFKYVDKFFTSLTNYLTYNYIFMIFVGLFLFTILCVLFFTSRSYEARLIKTVDRFNSYFIDNPQINEENLVAFNNKMKDKKVPKQLRKHWQQFVLYRENKASTYMSFENCVSNPIKNSTYTRDVKLMNILAWIFSLCSLVLNCYYCYEVNDIGAALSKILLTPVIILLLNYIIQIFLNIRHSAIVSDLFQNYQYFEVNIDKATETLPEYVDYEVLFDRNEIKKGIPILYAYLQKRAEEEQRELERARLRNVEHEKFNFDDQGINASLVLERAMQEAENYIAERKKYTQDIGQINADITQEDLNYREITKEYNRQMQASKETFANFKAQLEEVSSTIEANYLKKQQQQELDRQRNLERDFDTATEKHKKIIESYYAELDTIDKFIAQSRKNLEDAMKSEFSTYSSKVYDEAKKVAEEKLKEKIDESKSNIFELEEKLSAKEQELKTAYANNQEMSDKLQVALDENKVLLESGRKNKKFKQMVEPPVTENIVENVEPEYQPESSTETVEEKIETVQEEIPTESDSAVETNEIDEVPTYEEDFNKTDLQEDEPELNEIEEVANEENFVDEINDNDVQEVETDAENSEEVSTEQLDDGVEEKPASKRGRPRKVVDEGTIEKEKRKPGRPRKEQTDEVDKPKRGRGRPRKEVKTENVDSAEVKRGPGKPKKIVTDDKVSAVKKGRGRPRKLADEQKNSSLVKKGRGRPKKESLTSVKKAGRPKKQTGVQNELEDIDAYLKEIDAAIAAENAKLEETQKELAKEAKLKRKK